MMSINPGNPRAIYEVEYKIEFYLGSLEIQKQYMKSMQHILIFVSLVNHGGGILRPKAERRQRKISTRITKNYEFRRSFEPFQSPADRRKRQELLTYSTSKRLKSRSFPNLQTKAAHASRGHPETTEIDRRKRMHA